MSDFKKDVLLNNYCILINNNSSNYENYILYNLLDNIDELIFELTDIINNQKNINITKILKNTYWEATKELENTDVTAVTKFINNYINSHKANAQNIISYILIINNNNIVIIDNISKNIEDKIKTDTGLESNTNNIIRYLNDYISKIEKGNRQKSITKSVKSTGYTSKIGQDAKPDAKPDADQTIYAQPDKH